MARHCLCLDLVDDADSVERYRAWHRPGATPPAIIRSIRAADITLMEIYQIADRLIMIMETGPNFSSEAKAAADAADPDVKAWEQLMDQFQKPLSGAQHGEKWVSATLIFDLSGHPPE